MGITPRFVDYFEGRQVGWAQGRAQWRTLVPLRFWSAELGDRIDVPAEFITDLASVPRAPLAYWIAGGRGIRPSVVHDFAYQFGRWPTRTHPGGVAVDRVTADRVLWEALRVDPISGADRFVAGLMWAAVRAGGRGCWGDDARTKRLNPVWHAAGWVR